MVANASLQCSATMQAVEKAMRLYQEALEMQNAGASAEEASKAAVHLAHLCDDLLKVNSPGHSLIACMSEFVRPVLGRDADHSHPLPKAGWPRPIWI